MGSTGRTTTAPRRPASSPPACSAAAGVSVIAKLAPTARRRPGAALHELGSKLQFTADVFAISALEHLRHVHGMKRFFRDVATGRLPAFSIVDPSFVDFSEEPPQDILLGERFAATVIDAVMRGPAWPTTLLVWCYDEHGGYYDHVPPPPAIEPDDVRPRTDDPDARYDRYGFRVPAVIVSPYARPGAVLHEVFDHTSILRLLEDVWNLPSLTRRDAAATSPIGALDLELAAGVPPPAPAEPAGVGLGAAAVPVRRAATTLSRREAFSAGGADGTSESPTTDTSPAWRRWRR